MRKNTAELPPSFKFPEDPSITIQSFNDLASLKKWVEANKVHLQHHEDVVELREIYMAKLKELSPVRTTNPRFVYVDKSRVTEIHCRYCGVLCVENTDSTNPLQLTIDHIIPKSKGGSRRLENLGYACRRCNTVKNCNSMEKFRARLIEIECIPDGKFWHEKN